MRSLVLAPLIFSFLLAAAPAFAATAPSGAHDVTRAGGLTCFSIQPLDAPTNGPAGPRFPPHPAATYRSCDQLCADKHAAC
ncbi:MAG TPA: hypothetical protein VMF05_08675, partial [Stellaceae bacterium]|nr:hypothetical protein [Stellaceae bacterium]